MQGLGSSGNKAEQGYTGNKNRLVRNAPLKTKSCQVKCACGDGPKLDPSPVHTCWSLHGKRWSKTIPIRYATTVFSPCATGSPYYDGFFSVYTGNKNKRTKNHGKEVRIPRKKVIIPRKSVIIPRKNPARKREKVTATA